MNKNRNQGFTLLELLIVMAIIGILAVVFIPNVLAARTTAIDRAASAYSQQVYKASSAHISENINNSLVTGDCTSGYTAGGYIVDDPGPNTVTSCTIADTDADSLPDITVVSATGNTITLP